MPNKAVDMQRKHVEIVMLQQDRYTMSTIYQASYIFYDQTINNICSILFH